MCDSFVALADATADGSVIFAKNSDRPNGEGQTTQTYPAAQYPAATRLQCTYIDIPQARETCAVLISQIDWMWGAEMGANEHGVVIGNEAVWTTQPDGPPALLGMDLVRLGLERAASAEQAVAAITELLETFGQGGACAQNAPGFTYDNSYLIADAKEAYVLETAGRQWAAQRITRGVRNISNRLCLRADYDLASSGLRGDFAAQFSTAPLNPEPGSRELLGRRFLTQHQGQITPQSMMMLLRSHDSDICMHGAFETTAAMISWLHPDGRAEHWFTDAPNPCKAKFRKTGFATG